MSQKRFIAVLVSVVLLLIALNSATFLVRGIEQVVVVRMGKIVGVINDDTGLYFKWPIIDEVVSLDKRIMSMSSDAIRVPTSGNEFITVSTSTRWRISDPTMFIQTAKTEEAGANLLDQMLTASVRSHAAMLTVKQIVGGGLSMTDCTTEQTGCEYPEGSAGFEVATRAKQYGIELKDFRILRVSHTPNVHKEVESRMIAERLNASELVFEEGEFESAKIAAEAELKVQRITSEARRYRDNYLAATDREILTKLTEVYQEDPQFYSFFETISAYRSSLGDNTTLMIPANSEFFQHLKTSE